MTAHSKEIKMELEGYDYEELIDKWGLRKKYKKLYIAISKLNDLMLVDDDEMMRLHDELGHKLITIHIADSVSTDSDGNTFIDPEVLTDMVMFLDKLWNHAVVSEGDAAMYQKIYELSEKDETMFEFYRWFVHCLPLMWN